ncbi:MAG: signal peptidase I [Azonexus sp.]|jgi:signal peptidase I|uniref:signal peptidase I n=1 Tax=Azonexus sp. TaxID=1872668 RepID=UPI00282300BF|nr:signal peptidase I [Azonexus sp.]MDR0775944.1 signal peptidase I [Azonexus sp.]
MNLAPNFALILLVLLVATGVLYALNLKLRKQRPEGAKEPAWVAWGADFFPVILVVFVLRSFIVEPFKIPSGSMIPTLLVGDFILVNKYTYGIRLPVINKKIIAVNEPQRGDVMVFRYPEDPSLDYIKRVIGVPGDVVSYQNKRLTVNGEPVEMTRIDDYLYLECPKDPKQCMAKYFEQYWAKFGQVEHRLLNYAPVPASVFDVEQFPHRENCTYNAAGVICKVPAGHYFMMGDNRDNSRDSRSWGFVPEENIVGKAFFIWLNLSDPGRIGSFIK